MNRRIAFGIESQGFLNEMRYDLGVLNVLLRSSRISASYQVTLS